MYWSCRPDPTICRLRPGTRTPPPPSSPDVILPTDYWKWDEPADDPPPCPHPAVLPIPVRIVHMFPIHLRAPPPQHLLVPDNLSRLAPTPDFFSIWPDIPWRLCPDFHFRPKDRFVPVPSIFHAKNVPYTRLAPIECYRRWPDWPFVDDTETDQ